MWSVVGIVNDVNVGKKRVDVVDPYRWRCRCLNRWSRCRLYRRLDHSLDLGEVVLQGLGEVDFHPASRRVRGRRS